MVDACSTSIHLNIYLYSRGDRQRLIYFKGCSDLNCILGLSVGPLSGILWAGFTAPLSLCKYTAEVVRKNPAWNPFYCCFSLECALCVVEGREHLWELQSEAVMEVKAEDESHLWWWWWCMYVCWCWSKGFLWACLCTLFSASKFMNPHSCICINLLGIALIIVSFSQSYIGSNIVRCC